MRKVDHNTFQPYTLEKPEMKECYIAYLDMLGYKAFFEENPGKIDDMLLVFNQAIVKITERLHIFNLMFQDSDWIKFKIFSDNIIVWMEYKDHYPMQCLLLLFMELIRDFQTGLTLSYGIFLRGGIVRGQFAANNMFVFGKGLIDAVELEAKKAIFPRIIIDGLVISDLHNGKIFDDHEIFFEAIMKNCFFTDSDNFAVIDYLNIPDFSCIYTPEHIGQIKRKYETELPEYPSIAIESEVITDPLKRCEWLTYMLTIHKNLIEKQIEYRMQQYNEYRNDKGKLRNNERILKKYIWSMNYHNKTCDSSGNGNLKILYDISFDPIKDILYVHLITQDVSNIRG